MAKKVINLLKDLSGTTIVCNKPCCDGHEAENLLEDKEPGLMAESFIRPPVILEIQFPCPVRMKYIQIINHKGNFVSTAFEIRSSSEGKDMLQIFKLIGKGDDCSPGVVRFVNRQFVKKANTLLAAKAIQNEFSLFLHSRDLLTSSTGIHITITRTRKACPVVIKSLTIKGIPHDESLVKLSQPLPANRRPLPANCSLPISPLAITTTSGSGSHARQDTAVTSLAAFSLPLPLLFSHAANHPPVLMSLLATTSTSAGGNVVRQAKVSPQGASGIDIPPEFKCALTDELMSYPLILPSGKVIDQTSLEKLTEAARSVGRHPSDPFSGVPFSDSYKPMANHLLRERIDRFVSLNDIRSIGRATGTKRILEDNNSESNNAKSSRLELTADVEIKGQTPPEEKDNAMKSLNARVEALLNQPMKYRTVSLDTQPPNKKCAMCGRSYQNHYQSLGYYILPCKHVFCQMCLQLRSTGFCCRVCNKKTEQSKVDIYAPKIKT